MTTKPPSVQRAEKISQAQRTASTAARDPDPAPPPARKPDRARGWRGFTFSKKARSHQ